MSEAVRASISAIVADIEANPMARIGAQEGDHEAYEIVRRIERLIERKRATEPATAARGDAA